VQAMVCRSSRLRDEQAASYVRWPWAAADAAHETPSAPTPIEASTSHRYHHGSAPTRCAAPSSSPPTPTSGGARHSIPGLASRNRWIRQSRARWRPDSTEPTTSDAGSSHVISSLKLQPSRLDDAAIGGHTTVVHLGHAGEALNDSWLAGSYSSSST
jgi:hypothetical protein